MELGKYKQALAYLKSPRLPLANGTEIEAPPKKPYTFENFKKVADLYVQTYFGTQSVDLPGFPSKKEIVVDRLNQEYEKAMEAGVDSKDALGYIQDRKKFYLGLIDKGEDFPPSYGSEEIVERTDFADGLSALEFGKLQSATTAENLRRQLGPAQTGKVVPEIIKKALKEAGIKYTPGTGSGSKATFDNVTKETTKKFNELVRKLKKEQGIQMNLADAEVLKKRVRDFVLDKLKKGEYVSRPIIKKELNLTEANADAIINRALGEKQQAKSRSRSQYKGGLLEKLGKEERKQIMSKLGKERVRAKLESSDEIIKALNEEFKFDPDVKRGEELTKRIYGDAYDKADAAGKADLVNQVDNDIKKYLRALEGGYKPAGMVLPNQETINDIIDRIDTGEFKFSSGLKRNLVFDSIDNLLGYPSGTFRTQRRNLTQPGLELDEIFGLSNVSRRAPGYAEAFQLISTEANQAKKNAIDLPLSKLLRAIDEDKKTVVYKTEKMSLDNAIKKFNEDSLAFADEYQVRSPKINKGVKFKKSDYENFSSESVKNIEDTYKNKKYFLSEVKNKPVETFTQKLSPKAAGFRLSANPFADPELLSKYLSQIPKDAVNVGLKGLAALDVPVIQALFASMTDFAEDSPLITTLPLAFTDEASRLMGLYNESGGNFKKFSRFVARAGVPIEGAKKLFPILSKVGKIGSTYALPALQLGQETYQYKQELDRVREEAENFNLPIDKAMKAYDKFLDINTPPILDYDEEATLSDRGRQNLDAIKRDFQEIGSLFGISESPYKDDTPDQPSAFSPPLAERRKPNFKKDSGITSYRPSSDDRNFLAEGGIVQRLGFKDGTPKKGITRRSFLKLATLVPATMAGIASIRLGPAKTKKIFTTIENIKDSTTKIPDWFATFANKFRNTGIAENLFKTKKVKLTEDEYNKAVQAGEKRIFDDSARTTDYKINKPDHMDYYRLEDTDEVIATTYTNKKIPGVKIEDYGDEMVVNWDNQYNQPVEMRYQKGQDFVATDSRAYTTDPDGGFDVEDEIVRTVDDMYEGTSRTMEEFATGKKVKQMSSGELSAADAEIRANQLAEEFGYAKDIQGDPINLTTRDADD